MNYGWPLPSSLIEAGNGMIVVLVFFMLVSALLYFISQIRLVAAVEEKATQWDVAKRVYARTKASWAATLFFFGMFLRTTDVWWVRHVQNHHGTLGWFAPFATPLIVISSLPLIWGGVCWIRAVLPLRFSPSAWVFVAGGAVLFGILMAI